VYYYMILGEYFYQPIRKTDAQTNFAVQYGRSTIF